MITSSEDISQRFRYDVAVVGLGPVGLTLALALARQGVRLFGCDESPVLGHEPRAGHLDGEAMRFYHALGVTPALAPFVRRSRGLRVEDGAGRILYAYEAGDDPGPSGWGYGYQIFQPGVEAVLDEALRSAPSATVRRGHRVRAVAAKEDAVALGVEDLARGTTYTVEASYAVGCDGARSVVRAALGIPFLPFGPDIPYLVVDVALDPETLARAPDLPTLYADPERPRYFRPGAPPVIPSRWEFMMSEDEAASGQDEELLERLLRRYAYDIPRTEIRVVRRAAYVFHALCAERWREGRLFLAGDAAHVQPPFWAQGLCSGIRDAANLSWKLAWVLRGLADETLLDTYESERRPHALAWIDEALRLGAIVTGRRELLRGASQPSPDQPFRPILPRLGPGLSGDRPSPAGTMAPQPVHAGRYLDDLVGGRFLLALATDLAEALPQGRRSPADEERLRVLDAREPLVADLLKRLGHGAALIRPDRYVLGVADDPQGVATLLMSLPWPAPATATRHEA